MEEEASKNYDLMPVVLYILIFPFIIGLLLRLPKLLIEMKQHKQWKFDWVKFIAISLPTFYIMLISNLVFSPFGTDFIKIPEIIMIESPTIQITTGIVLGYTLMDSLKK